MDYGFNQIKIDNLFKINLNKLSDQVYYIYKNISFYYKKINQTSNLVVSFHGRLYQIESDGVKKNVSLPIFRGYNWNYNILCFSDRLLEDYHKDEIKIGWFLSTNKNDYQNIYLEIIKYFTKTYNKIVFFGSSAGGYPSLFYANYFNQYALVLNSQVYLQVYCYYKTLNKILKQNKRVLKNTNFVDDLFKYGLAKKVYYYQNINDTIHYENHGLPFQKLIKSKNLEHIYNFNFFIGATPTEDKTHHHINLPENITNDYLINKIFAE
jgi:hypothetical protein